MDTTNKKTSTFMLDHDVVAEIARLALLQRISKSAVVNGLLAELLFRDRAPIPRGKPGPKTISTEIPPAAKKPAARRKRSG